jgi:drug/metabolite transporter (DMT)-like permease
MYLAGVIDAIIFYPVVNGASMILTTAAGILLWKEKLSKRQWFGLIMGGVAILLLCNIL